MTRAGEGELADDPLNIDCCGFLGVVDLAHLDSSVLVTDREELGVGRDREVDGPAVFGRLLGGNSFALERSIGLESLDRAVVAENKHHPVRGVAGACQVADLELGEPWLRGEDCCFEVPEVALAAVVDRHEMIGVGEERD